MQLLELRDWVKEQTLVPSSDSIINGYINRAYFELAAAHDWPWLETSYTFDQVGEVAGYALPEDLQRLLAVVYTGQGAAAQPVRTTRDSVLARFGGDVGESTLPAEYYRQGNDLIFVPTPSGDQGVVLFYLMRPEALDADDAEPLFDPAFHVYLAEAASALYFESEESFEYAAYYNAKAAEIFARMTTFYDIQMPPEQPLVIGGGVRRARPLPFSNWPE